MNYILSTLSTRLIQLSSSSWPALISKNLKLAHCQYKNMRVPGRSLLLATLIEMSLTDSTIIEFSLSTQEIYEGLRSPFRSHLWKMYLYLELKRINITILCHFCSQLNLHHKYSI